MIIMMIMMMMMMMMIMMMMMTMRDVDQHIAPIPRSEGTKHNYAKNPDIADDHEDGDQIK